MKIIKISLLENLEKIDITNSTINVSVEIDDEYTYKLSLTTPKHLEFLINKDKMDYYKPGCPFILVNKLTPEIIHTAVRAFVEEDGGYWLPIYHFGGWQGAIDESIFDYLKVKHLKKQEEFDKELDEDE